MVNPYQAYIKTDLETQSIPKIISSAYERIIMELKLAKQSIEDKDIKGKIDHIYKAIDMLRVLRSGLDFEKGGEIAKNLDQIYDFLERHISLGNARNDGKFFDEAIDILNTVKSGWDEIG